MILLLKTIFKILGFVIALFVVVGILFILFNLGFAFLVLSAAPH